MEKNRDRIVASEAINISNSNRRFRFRNILIFVVSIFTVAFALHPYRYPLPTEPSPTTSTHNTPAACIPPIPLPFLLNEKVIHHPAVKEALEDIRKFLENLTNGSKDSLSFSIVHAASGKIFEFYHGRIRLNESASQSPDLVDGDSVYRIASVTKVFAILEALYIATRSRLMGYVPELTLDTRVQAILPSFQLPLGYENEAGEITLAHLGSHRSGLSRDIGNLEIGDLRDIVYPPVNGTPNLYDPYPRNFNQTQFLDAIASNDLVWKVAETPSYSNTGFGLLGAALEEYRKHMYNGVEGNFSAIVPFDLFRPLNMTHSFFGAIPDILRKHVTIPNGVHFVDKEFPSYCDPAGGMFSTSNDLASFIHRVLLSPNPHVITSTQRLNWLKPTHTFTDGKTSVGVPWEIDRITLPDSSVHQIYDKGGSLPFHFSQISTLPDLGYGVVALTAIGFTLEELSNGANYTNVHALTRDIHNILAPAFLKSYNSLLVEEYVGVYVSGNSKASIIWSDEFNMLVIESFVVDGVDILFKFDEVFWVEIGKRPRLFDKGAKIVGTGFEGVFRLGLIDGCDWLTYSGLTTRKGHGFDKIKFERDEDGLQQLVYEPIPARLTRR